MMENTKAVKGTTTWHIIASAVSRLVPTLRIAVGDGHLLSSEGHCTILSVMLYHSVSDACENRKTFIGRILELSRECQQRLMKVIEDCKKLDGTPSKAAAGEMVARAAHRGTPVGVRLRSRSDVLSTPSGYTPQRKRASMGQKSAEEMFSPATFDSSLEKMVRDLRKQNESLQDQLKYSQQHETELGQKMQELEARYRKDTMRLESDALRREEETRDEYERKLSDLRGELDDLSELREQDQRAQQELANVRDEMELLEHTKEKLAETEEKLRKCRERMEQLGDVKDALKREEEAHSTSVEECLRLENELKALQPLRRQLDDYKTRAVNAEVQLAECQEDLKRMAQISQTISSAHKELLKGARLQHDEAEELRRRLVDEQGDKDVEGEAVADGLR